MDNYNNYLHSSDSESWQSVAEPFVKVQDNQTELGVGVSEVSLPYSESNNGRHISAPVLTFQLVICIMILIFSYVSSTFFSDFFQKIKFVYDKEINASMCFSGDFSDLNYSDLFGASDDEV